MNENRGMPMVYGILCLLLALAASITIRLEVSRYLCRTMQPTKIVYMPAVRPTPCPVQYIAVEPMQVTLAKLLNGAVVYYDLMTQEPRNYAERYDLRYLGYGYVYSVNNVIQGDAHRSYGYFYERVR